MRGWLVRGLGMAVLHGAGQVTVATARADAPESASVAVALVLAVLVGAGVLWGAIDGWRRVELPGWRWLAAGLIAGPLAGLVGVVGQSLLVDETGMEALLIAVTGGAAFTALLVMASTGAGILAGRTLDPPGAGADPDRPAAQRRSASQRSASP